MEHHSMFDAVITQKINIIFKDGYTTHCSEKDIIQYLSINLDYDIISTEFYHYLSQFADSGAVLTNANIYSAHSEYKNQVKDKINKIK